MPRRARWGALGVGLALIALGPCREATAQAGPAGAPASARQEAPGTPSPAAPRQVPPPAPQTASAPESGPEAASAPAPDPPPATPEDAALAERLRRAFLAIDELAGVIPVVYAGVVRLEGTVPGRREAQLAVSIASRVPGVLHAVDALEVPDGSASSYDDQDAAIAQRLRAVFAEVDDMSGLTVEVRGGVVHLQGTAPEQAMADQAAELARGLDGVVIVESKVTIPSGVAESVGPVIGRLQELATRGLRLLPSLGVAAVVFALALLLGRGIRVWRLPWRRVAHAPLMQGLARQVAGIVVVLVGLVVALQLMGATALVGAVLGTAGLAGIAIGFAFRDIAENYLASLILGAWRPFEANDHVIVGGEEGKVVRLTTRETVLMTLDGNHLRIPNAVVFKSVILNYTRNPLRRFHFRIGIGGTEDLARAQKIGVASLKAVPAVLADPPPFSRVEELADFNVVVQYFGWVDQRQADVAKVRSEAIRLTKIALDEAGVDMPVPRHDVRLLSEPEEARSDGALVAPTRRPAPAHAPAPGAALGSEGVGVDDHLEQQMAADRRRHPEQEDLLAQDGADPPVTGTGSGSGSVSGTGTGTGTGSEDGTGSGSGSGAGSPPAHS